MPELSSFAAVLKVALGFGLVIFVHEFGHFIVALRNGVFVEKFVIGFDFFGARLFSWTRGGTEYVIGAFPLGGYVKMLGQHDLPDESEGVATDPRSFQAKTVWQRTAIISAGVIANFVSAFALCYIAFMVGHHRVPAEVGSVAFDALDSGLRSGDVVIQAAGNSISSWDELLLTYATEEPGADIDLLINRAGQELKLSMPVHRNPALPINTPSFSSPIEMRVGTLTAGLPAEVAGVQLGDRLLAVDGHPVTGWGEFQRLIQRRPGMQIILTVGRSRDGEEQRLDIEVRPDARNADLVPPFDLGLVPEQPPVVDFVAAGSPAADAGFLVGDKVIAVGGVPVASWYALWRHVAWEAPEGRSLQFVLDRGGDQLEVEAIPGPRRDWMVQGTGLAELGIAGRSPGALVVAAVEPGGAASRADLRAGDSIVFVRGLVKGASGTETYEEAEPSWARLIELVGYLAEARLELEILRGGERREATLQLEEVPQPIQMGFLGVGPIRKESVVKLGPIEAIGPSIVAPFRLLRDLIAGLQAMFQRRASAKLLTGPVGILHVTYAYAEKSTGDLLNFLALLSVNLAVVNFLPIPITDGGHFVFLMYEKAKGRRMDRELEARFQWAGLVFILLVFLFATFNDVGRLFGF